MEREPPFPSLNSFPYEAPMIERDRFITDNLKLVHSCCHRFTGRGIEYEELYSAGCEGLIKAADHFDPSRGFAFSTYAVPVILGEIKRLFREGGSVKVGRSLKELSLKASRAADELTKSLGREPAVSEVAAALGVSCEEATEALCAAQPALSLTFETEDGVEELQLSSPGVEEEVADALALRQVLDRLPERDGRLITLRFFMEQSQAETARQLGMTQVQVSRRERAILQELRKKLVT